MNYFLCSCMHFLVAILFNAVTSLLPSSFHRNYFSTCNCFSHSQLFAILQEAVLQATQYIPDIVRLQKQLFDELHHRVNHKIAHTLSMHDFISRQHTGMSVFFKSM